jgi:hypothetical protein
MDSGILRQLSKCSKLQDIHKTFKNNRTPYDGNFHQLFPEPLDEAIKELKNLGYPKQAAEALLLSIAENADGFNANMFLGDGSLSSLCFPRPHMNSDSHSITFIGNLLLRIPALAKEKTGNAFEKLSLADLRLAEKTDGKNSLALRQEVLAAIPDRFGDKIVEAYQALAEIAQDPSGPTTAEGLVNAVVARIP